MARDKRLRSRSPSPNRPRRCGVCEMWLNGQRQYDRHLLGFKHKKHTMFEDFARHETLTLSMVLHMKPSLLSTNVSRGNDGA